MLNPQTGYLLDPGAVFTSESDLLLTYFIFYEEYFDLFGLPFVPHCLYVPAMLSLYRLVRFSNQYRSLQCKPNIYCMNVREVSLNI